MEPLLECEQPLDQSKDMSATLARWRRVRSSIRTPNSFAAIRLERGSVSSQRASVWSTGAFRDDILPGSLEPFKKRAPWHAHCEACARPAYLSWLLLGRVASLGQRKSCQQMPQLQHLQSGSRAVELVSGRCWKLARMLPVTCSAESARNGGLCSVHQH